MSANNPTILASDIITDVEVRLGSPNISGTDYLPWISYAYQKLFASLYKAGQKVREQLFGNYLAVTLTNGTAEYTLSSILPRFISPIKFEILFGGTGDSRVRLNPAGSIYKWDNQANVSTSYRPKQSPIYYILQDKLGIIPTPPSSDSANAILYAWFVRGPYQITDTADSIDIPYRFIYPIVNYVQAKAIQKQHEDYSEASLVEQTFERELEQIAITASDENNENDGQGIEHADSALSENPFRW